MKTIPVIPSKLFFVILLVASFFSCSKKESSPAPAVDPCAGKTIIITPTVVSATACGGASINIAATGSTGFTYKLNSGGTYQTAAAFNSVSAGTYTIFVKDAAGCEQSTSVTVNSEGTAGPLFTAAKNLISAKCQSCHNNSVQNGGMNWEVECNIVTHKANIKNRAVDLGTMPPTGPLTQAEKDIITNWINAGGSYTD
jgi:uncharacterized membrane protein